MEIRKQPQNILFTKNSTVFCSKTHSENRLKKAYNLLGEYLVNKFIGFALFLLGVNHKRIAEKINIPIGTFLSFLTRIDHIGIAAFGDRRRSTSFQVKQTKSQKLSLSLKKEKNNFNIIFNHDDKIINLPIDFNIVQDNPINPAVRGFF